MKSILFLFLIGIGVAQEDEVILYSSSSSTASLESLEEERTPTCWERWRPSCVTCTNKLKFYGGICCFLTTLCAYCTKDFCVEKCCYKKQGNQRREQE